MTYDLKLFEPTNEVCVNSEVLRRLVQLVNLK